MQRYSETCYWKAKKKAKSADNQVTLTAYGGVRVPIKGTCSMKIKHNDQNIDVKFFVVTVDKAQPLIGLQACRNLELISINNDVDKKNSPEPYAKTPENIGRDDRHGGH